MIRAGYYIVLSLLLSFSAQAAEEKPAVRHGLNVLKSDSVAKHALGAGSYIQMILGLLFIVLLIFALAWFMRRMGRLQSVMGGSMKLLGGVSLGQRERAVLVQVGETQMLLGVAPGSVRTLHVFDKPVVTASAIAAGDSFADKLGAVLKQKAVK
ncbi:Flagellar biosynthesis protein FliQ [hydrothermal vent metagenome]|uniref:Flagellar biosynthesis protein FliQ n=1 Tax=hydrothermal vent metagenome TaxID=652676 RepID=A0A3B1BH16_9ZZZZ